ncbi:MAG: DNA double-strand break repair nuclease NurA [Nitrososphaeria archaeon]
MGKLREEKDIEKMVKEMWIEYMPDVSKANLAGIDSSWNSTRHHGFFFYVVDAVAVDSSGNYIVDPKYIADIGAPVTEEEGITAYNTQRYLESLGMSFEYELAMEAINRGYTALIDNSALAMIYDRRNKMYVTFIQYAKELINRKDVIFIAKTSESNTDLKGEVGDMYYYTKYTNKAGISKVRYDPHGVSVFYARLSDWAPVIKVEVPGWINESEALKVVRKLYSVSVNGYPYPLLLAHQRCKVDDKDMETAEALLGLGAEPGAREVLWE